MSQLKSKFLSVANRIASPFGYQVRIHRAQTLANAAPSHQEIYREVAPYTMTSIEKVVALCTAVEYVVRANISGAFVECGVAHGGSMMAVAKALLGCGVRDRDLYLFDTFEGMPEPSLHDSESERTKWQSLRNRNRQYHGYDLEYVKSNMERVGYPRERIKYVKGMVQDTVPDRAPGKIALLRLDTDWYESTRHELRHLYPRLSERGVLLIDDYGFHEGCKKAVDEYFHQTESPPLLTRIDDGACLGVKAP